MSKEEAVTLRKAYLLYALPSLFLLYFLWGALSGRLSLPGRSDILHLGGISAWVACLFPLLWLVSDVVRYDPRISLNRSTRKIIANLLFVSGSAFFFYAVVL